MTKKLPANLSIGSLAGAPSPLLPGESEQDYQTGLVATISELEAQSPLQVYLAEKIFDCLWWIQRYERHKLHSLIMQMADTLTGTKSQLYGPSKLHLQIATALENNDWQDPTLRAQMNAKNHNQQTLIQAATAKEMSRFASIDQQIAMRVKTLSGFQGAYEGLVNRRVHAERLKLQNDLIKRDLAAIDLPVVKDDAKRLPKEAKR